MKTGIADRRQARALPYEWRITKYNPVRNAHGHYVPEEWTSFSDIGRFYNGHQLTYEEYFAWESAYVSSALDFLYDAGISTLQVVALENHRPVDFEAERLQGVAFKPNLLKDGCLIGGQELEDVMRLNLREVLWCKLVADNKFYIHFGYDYYMYIGSPSLSVEAVREAKRKGLFVEEMPSPYH